MMIAEELDPSSLASSAPTSLKVVACIQQSCARGHDGLGGTWADLRVDTAALCGELLPAVRGARRPSTGVQLGGTLVS